MIKVAVGTPVLSAKSRKDRCPMCGRVGLVDMGLIGGQLTLVVVHSVLPMMGGTVVDECRMRWSEAGRISKADRERIEKRHADKIRNVNKTG